MEDCNLTQTQHIALAARLIDTQNNIYSLSEKMFGSEANDADFDALGKLSSRQAIFKCESCGVWKGLDQQSLADTEACTECFDGDEDEDE